LLQLELLRRARVWDDLDWKYIEVGQRWKAGEVGMASHFIDSGTPCNLCWALLLLLHVRYVQQRPHAHACAAVLEGWRGVYKLGMLILIVTKPKNPLIMLGVAAAAACVLRTVWFCCKVSCTAPR
jgi:hypothetical protein